MKSSFDYIGDSKDGRITHLPEGLVAKLHRICHYFFAYTQTHIDMVEKYCEISRVVIYIIYNRLLIGDAQSELQTRI